MTITLLTFIAANILLFIAVAIVWIRQTNSPKEDSRLSRGLQLLQSKISVLEDLSDRTETQVRQLTQILEERAKNLKTTILNADTMIRKIEKNMSESMKVAEIFQDKIPHEEIIERSQTQKYVKAAKMAHAGSAVEDIIKETGLVRSEAELIAKLNKDQLTFDPELLPAWAQGVKTNDVEAKVVEQIFGPQENRDLSSLQRVEQEFKHSVRQHEEHERREAERIRQFEQRKEAILRGAKDMTNAMADQVGRQVTGAVKSAGQALRTTSENFRTRSEAMTRTLLKATERVAEPVINEGRVDLEQSLFGSSSEPGLGPVSAPETLTAPSSAEIDPNMNAAAVQRKSRLYIEEP